MTIFAFSFSVIIKAQSGIDYVLTEIKKNNKTIKATSQHWEAEKLQYRVGATPYNPTVEYDYLEGRPESVGEQNEFSITQSFDFPSVYFKKNQLAKQLTTQTDYKLNAFVQDVLLVAKQTCIELVYQYKLQQQLKERMQNAERMAQDFQTRLDKGDGNILDANKAKLQLIEIRNEFQDNVSAINQLNQKLTELNGGSGISFADSTYPILPLIPSFDQLEKEYESYDPVRKDLELQKTISQKQVEVSRALSYPKMELGYRYQGNINQTFSGIHAGISIPLWENRYRVKQQIAQSTLADLELQAHVHEHYYHIKHIYEKYTNLKIVLNDYQTAISVLNNTALLAKALSLGELSTIEYFMESMFFNNAMNNYLQTEKEYYLTIAELYKYQL
ncbi:MAG: TolC family protein [Bacteroidia bacterium]|nr:TolC family protein [Bacteroidia bacterium]